ncbi:MAG: calcium/sodium antiporter [Clostridioides sp.]|nr:calcium/sodium antiporter [Clostridioides sp.]
MIITILIFILGFILITKGADLFINCTVEIGKVTKIPNMVLGATIVSFATTLPEFSVSLMASISNHTTMALGNAIGSIICNTGLALGLVGILKPFKIDKKSFFYKSSFLMISLTVFLILGMDKSVGGLDSVILLSMLGIYMYMNYSEIKHESISRNFGNNKSIDTNQSKNNNSFKKSLYYTIKNRKNIIKNKASKNTNKIHFIRKYNLKKVIKTVFIFFLGLTMMLAGSKFLIESGIKISYVLNIPKGIVSLTVIALGTSLPELVSALTAMKKGCSSITVGNIIGANTLNLLSVIGASSVANPLPVLDQSRLLDFPVMILIILVLVVPTYFKHKISRMQGFLMLAIYTAYMIILYKVYL